MAAIKPARASDDFPLPEGPISARNRFSAPPGAVRSALSSHPTSASRPKKNAWCSTSNGSSPRYGFPSISTAPTGLAPGSSPRMPHASRWKAASSSSEFGNSTHVVATRKTGSLLRSSRFAPGSRTGITRNSPRPSRIRRSIAARTCSFCHGGAPVGPIKTAQAADPFSASSSASCHGVPGDRHHLSNQGSRPASVRRAASSSTAGWSATLWDRKTPERRAPKSCPRRSRMNSAGMAAPRIPAVRSEERAMLQARSTSPWSSSSR